MTPQREDTGDWTPFSSNGDTVSWRSVSLEAYETGYDEGDARLRVTCFNSENLGKYLSVSVRWDSYVSVLDDLSVHLNWDSGPTEFERWDAGGDGDRVNPRFSTTHRHDKAFIAKLMEHRHLGFTVESYDGFHNAKFNLEGFSVAFRVVAEYCG